MPTDDHELEGLDPYALLDAEAGRIEQHLASLPEARWSEPSRCAGWSVRDVLCHLAATERYHHACFDGSVASLFDEIPGDDEDVVAAWNERGVRTFDGAATSEVLARWQVDDAETRRRFRGADGSDIDSSIGAYPARWQAFHVASELAVHADDVGVVVPASDASARRMWRSRVSRFALAEAKPGVVVTADGDRTTVRSDATTVTVDDDVLIEGVAGRLPATALDDASRALLCATP